MYNLIMDIPGWSYELVGKSLLSPLYEYDDKESDCLILDILYSGCIAQINEIFI